MSAIAVQIAVDVVALLNGAPDGTFSEKFTARRSYRPTVKLKDLKCVDVIVIPPPFPSMERISRGQWAYTHPIRIGVLKKLTGNCENDSREQTDALLLFDQQIIDYMRAPSRIKLTNSGAVLDSVEVKQDFNEEWFQENREFVAFALCHYLVAR